MIYLLKNKSQSSEFGIITIITVLVSATALPQLLSGIQFWDENKKQSIPDSVINETEELTGP